MKNFIVGIFVVIALSLSSTAQEAKSQWNLVEYCKKDCPEAKSDEDAHKCAEKIGKLNKKFRKSKCWEVNEKYETAKEAEEKAN